MVVKGGGGGGSGSAVMVVTTVVKGAKSAKAPAESGAAITVADSDVATQPVATDPSAAIGDSESKTADATGAAQPSTCSGPDSCSTDAVDGGCDASPSDSLGEHATTTTEAAESSDSGDLSDDGKSKARAMRQIVEAEAAAGFKHAEVAETEARIEQTQKKLESLESTLSKVKLEAQELDAQVEKLRAHHGMESKGEPPSGDEELPKELVCPKCTHVLALPHMLPCGHTFCFTCLLDHLANKGVRMWFEKTCPQCATKVDGVMASVPNETVEGILSSLMRGRVEEGTWKVRVLAGERLKQGFQLSLEGHKKLYGISVPSNHRGALVKFAAASKFGDTYSMGQCFYHGVNVETDKKNATELFRRAVDEGSVGALLMLAKCYLSGEGVDKDEATAFNLFQSASINGCVVADTELGHWHCGFNSLAKTFRDPKEAVKMYRKAAEQGYAEAQYRLGDCYRWGALGVEESVAEGNIWFTKAANQGHSDAYGVLHPRRRGR